MFMNATADIEQLRYPVGKYTTPNQVDSVILEQWKNDIAKFPKLVEDAIVDLTAEQYAWKYRPEGWTVRQVIHHCADSHMNAFIRVKLLLTEEQPTIKPYAEERWAELPDALQSPVEESILIIKGVHARWSLLLNAIPMESYSRTYLHPQYNRVYRLDVATGLYAWHCRHHLAHIQQAIRLKITD